MRPPVSTDRFAAAAAGFFHVATVNRHVEFDQSESSEAVFAVKDGKPSRTVLRALTAVHDGDPTKLRPLHDVVDVDALDDLFRDPPLGTVTFEYEGYTVIVRHDAEVAVRE